MNKIVFDEDLEQKFEGWENNDNTQTILWINSDISNNEKRLLFLADAILNDDSNELDINLDSTEFILQDDVCDMVWPKKRNEEKYVYAFFKVFNTLDESDIKSKELFQNVLKQFDNYKNDNYFKYKDYLERIDEEIYGENKEKNIVWKIIFVILNVDGDFNSKKERDKVNDIFTKRFKDALNNINIKNTKSKIVLEIYYKNDVIKCYNSKNDASIFVSVGILNLDKENNFLIYDIENKNIKNSMICNLSANSIHKLWKERGNNLLGLNLRFHITNKKIDSEIKNSMVEKPELFWIKNNGLVILCEDYSINNDKIKLKNFSVINGGQTTYNIGNIANADTIFETTDFFVPAKIIKIPKMNIFSNNDERDEIFTLANEIAEATNSQKAIKNQDLIANLPDIKNAKMILSDSNQVDNIFFISSRRGEKLSKEWKETKFKDKWQQKTTAEQLLQICASVKNFLPGTARAGKAKLYNAEKIKKNFEYISKNPQYFSDLLLFNNYFNLYFKPKKKYLAEFNKPGAQNVCKFGLYFLLSSIPFIIYFLKADQKQIEELDKIEVKIDEMKNNLSTEKETESFISEFIKKRLDNERFSRVFKKELVIDSNSIKTLFHKEVKNFINNMGDIFSDSYNYSNVQKNSVVSNFTKTNKNYWLFFVPELIKYLKKNLDNLKVFFDIVEI